MSELLHYGTPRHSGRYPWGSGENPYQHEKRFISKIRDLKKEGFSEVEIAKSFDMSVKELRALQSIAHDEVVLYERQEAMRLLDKGYSKSAIGKRMGKNESYIRLLLKEETEQRRSETKKVADQLLTELKRYPYLDVGPGTEIELGINRNKLDTAITFLKREGYDLQQVYVEQAGNPGKYTTVSVLAPAGTTKGDIIKNIDNIHIINERIIDIDGSTKLGVMNTKGVSSKRVQVNYKEDGGDEKDGIIELRRGVDDISLGKANYAQVRIAVDGTHYLKGMAVYRDDMPDGVDIIFNTNKHRGTNKKDVFKKMDDDPDNPFGSNILDEKGMKLTQKYYIDKNGKKQLSAINIVNEEGKWDTWSRNLASQFLSKQSTSLAKRQLDLAYADKKAEYEEIKNLTNPALKKKLLDSFASDCDASAVHLKAAALPRQSTKVILPVNMMKDDQIYAPTYENGVRVALVRYPHGSIAEIPELTVNNNNKEVRKMLHNVTDAVGINHNVAGRLSGADFDGDTVLVIPITNKKGEKIIPIQTSTSIKESSPLHALKDFDPKEEYKLPDSAPRMKKATKQNEMGKTTNLVTDMQLKGATDSEIARAIKHTMVVIDAEKHHLDYKKSERDNGIKELKKKYQDKETGGASTLISRASAEKRVGERKRSYTPDPKTGEYTYYETNGTYIKPKYNDKGEKISETVVVKTNKTTQMMDAFESGKDAYSLVSTANTKMERVYANYANQMRALANTARKEMMATKNSIYSPSANKTYSKEVEDLNAKLQIALKNAPRERKAQLLANSIFREKLSEYPHMDYEEKKKKKAQALGVARTRLGAKKEQISITDKEWDAIQAGAISNNQLTKILNNTDLDELKKRATPKSYISRVTPAKEAQIKALSNAGYTIADISEKLGFSTSTVSGVING